jgi:hypothetical protein
MPAVTELWICDPQVLRGNGGKLSSLPPLQNNDSGPELGPWMVSRGFLGLVLKQVSSWMLARSLSL